MPTLFDTRFAISLRSIRLAACALSGLLLIGGIGRCDEKVVTSPEPNARLEEFAWLAGLWTHKTDSQLTEEMWLPPKDGLMLGCSRTTGPSRKPFFEFVRIQVVGDEIHYIAQPMGSPPSSFPLKECTGEKILFENLSHDFPQRISYTKTTEGGITARVEGEINGKLRVEEWNYVKK